MPQNVPQFTQEGNLLSTTKEGQETVYTMHCEWHNLATEEARKIKFGILISISESQSGGVLTGPSEVPGRDLARSK